MDDFRERRVVGFQPDVPDAERQVGILIISRGVELIESLELAPDFGAQHDARARAIVDLADVVETRFVRILVASVVPSAEIRKKDAAGLLQFAVGIDELRADKTDVAKILKHV